MEAAAFTPFAVLGLILFRWSAEAVLLAVNLRHTLSAASKPAAGEDPRSAGYTAAKVRQSQWELAWTSVCLASLLLSGALPWSRRWAAAALGSGALADSVWIFAVGLALTAADLPLEWRRQFRLEEKFGFNTTTQRTWWADQAKSLALGAALGIPLILLILRLFAWAGAAWWWEAWAAMLAFQLLVAWLAPVVLLPLFNRLTPMQDGPLRDRLLNLGRRAGFPAGAILVMDGSRRSRHANAFFTGFGRLRRIVLFDTLLEQLDPEELEAVLAHEIGHYKLGHVARMLAGGAAATLAGFAALAWLAGEPWLAESLGFGPNAGLAPTLLLFGLLSGPALFWVAPVANHWSRRHEYQADAYAARLIGRAAPLAAALRRLNEKNLANPHPHPLYSAWHYSHPTLEERERALGVAA